MTQQLALPVVGTHTAACIRMSQLCKECVAQDMHYTTDTMPQHFPIEVVSLENPNQMLHENRNTPGDKSFHHMEYARDELLKLSINDLRALAYWLLAYWQKARVARMDKLLCCVLQCNVGVHLGTDCTKVYGRPVIPYFQPVYIIYIYI